MNHLKAFIALFISLWNVPTVWAQLAIYDSGGPLIREQAAYDVHFYDLELSIDPDQQRIEGILKMQAQIVHPTHWLVMDLDTLLKIRHIQEAGQNLEFRRELGRVWIDLKQSRQPGSAIELEIAYGGKPRVAPRPPWNGGFTWAKTPKGSPWIATTCQMIGADVWWPCKDHVSDEPDSMALHVRVPEPLVVASNGRLFKEEKNQDQTTTYHWFISNPINIYNVALNIAPYRSITGSLESVAGEKFPVVFYVLPEDYEKGQKLFPEILDHLRFFEKHFGPYPFRADKYGVAQTPHLGMEHQTIIAYGANFSNGSMTGGKDWGFDALHHHELSHEWWGNLVTNADWKDMWIHEGFGTYTQALYLEEKQGMEVYHQYMDNMRRFRSELAVAPKASQTAQQIYRAPIYSKGAWILHSLRFLVGKEVLMKSLRKMAYPDPALEQITDGSQTRLVTTDDFIQICEEMSGKELNWFFEVYARQPKLPTLLVEELKNSIRLSWKTPENMPFPMPVEIEIEDNQGQFRKQRVEIPVSGAEVKLDLSKDNKIEIDPENWVMMEIEEK